MNKQKILVGEAVGTAILMLGGPGSAILAGDKLGFLGVSMAFGFSLLIAAYIVGPVTGCHINPAVTVGMWAAKKIESASVAFYVIGQLIGAAVGGLIIYVVAKGLDGFDAKNNFAANGWGAHSPKGYGLGPAIIVEIALTALLVFAVLSTTRKDFAPGFGGVVAGLTLALIHLISIPVDNTSVNPARSFGAAIFAGGDALSQLWAFIVFPIIGALVGVGIWLALGGGELKDTIFGGKAA
jgi:aquaporin Z